MKTLEPKDLKGQIVVAEFWATWCGPCLRSVPHLVDIQKKFRNKGVILVALTEEGDSKVQPFIEKYKMSYIIGTGAGITQRAYGIKEWAHVIPDRHRGQSCLDRTPGRAGRSAHKTAPGKAGQEAGIPRRGLRCRFLQEGGQASQGAQVRRSDGGVREHHQGLQGDQGGRKGRRRNQEDEGQQQGDGHVAAGQGGQRGQRLARRRQKPAGSTATRKTPSNTTSVSSRNTPRPMRGAMPETNSCF